MRNGQQLHLPLLESTKDEPNTLDAHNKPKVEPAATIFSDIHIPRPVSYTLQYLPPPTHIHSLQAANFAHVPEHIWFGSAKEVRKSEIQHQKYNATRQTTCELFSFFQVDRLILNLGCYRDEETTRRR